MVSLQDFVVLTQKLELHSKQIVPSESTAEGFHLNGNIIGFGPQTWKLELHTKQIVPSESTTEEVWFKWSHHNISFKDSKIRTTN